MTLAVISVIDSALINCAIKINGQTYVSLYMFNFLSLNSLQVLEIY